MPSPVPYPYGLIEANIETLRPVPPIAMRFRVLARASIGGCSSADAHVEDMHFGIGRECDHLHG